MQKPQGLADLASSAFGRRTIEIEFVEDVGAHQAGCGNGGRGGRERSSVWCREAVDLFGAHVVQVRRTEQPVNSGGEFRRTTPETQG